ncbi:hypothetical protein EVAR_11715_1 [Eumeta japonica]|uniref:Uncharacterized protein n=1 Tax=Eumeta variegata TaxID=151549 RepID=A0A4C1U4U5_EUMVA|nr:hypothetical protein EVAR_11715_1 [Eumeta japonica]
MQTVTSTRVSGVLKLPTLAFAVTSSDAHHAVALYVVDERMRGTAPLYFERSDPPVAESSSPGPPGSRFGGQPYSRDKRAGEPSEKPMNTPEESPVYDLSAVRERASAELSGRKVPRAPLRQRPV